MRDTTERLAQMLEGSRQVTWEANVVREDKYMDGLPVMMGGLTWDAGQQVEASGSMRLLIVDEQGLSHAPREAGDLFAPFGSEVMLSARVALDGMVERVQVMRARIAKVPSVRAQREWLSGEWVTLSEVIALDIQDRMSVLKADEFDADTPIKHRSAWAELQHLCPFPVIQDGPDVTLPAALAHTKSRADAVQTIAARLGGVAAFDSAGNLIVRRESSTPVATLRLGPDGTVSEVGAVMDPEGVYNRVVVRGKTAAGAIIQAVRVAGDPLSPESWGTRTYTADQGEFIATQQQADEYAVKLLARVSTVATSELEVQCLLDPRLELGDVAIVEWDGQEVPVRVTRIGYGDPMMTVRGEVL